MSTRPVYTLLLAALGCSTLVNMGCNKENPVESSSPTSSFPPLTDPIPFDKLGQGKLVFERLGPYGGVYVVDIDHRRSWGLGGVGGGPAASPDGERIAYTALTPYPSETYYDVYIMNIDGTNRQRVSDFIGQEHSPSWTSDGKQILYQAWTFSPANGVSGLYRQSPVPNPVDRVPVYETQPYNVIGPVSASPDGKLAFSSAGIWTMSIDGSNLRLVSSPSGRADYLYSPAWSPDGQRIAFMSMLRDSSYKILSIAIVVIAADGGNAGTLVTLPASGLTEYSGDNSYSLCWSPDGSKIAFTRPDGPDVGSHIYLINKDGTGLTQITTAEGVTDRSLSWGH
jgi:Tol biopolymer transport system component